MTTNSLRNYLLYEKPSHVKSASSLARLYQSNTPTVVRTLEALGYERSTDNTGWYLNNPVEAPANYLSITVPKTEAAYVAFKKLVPEEYSEFAYAYQLLKEAVNERPPVPSKLLKRLAVYLKIAEEEATVIE